MVPPWLLELSLTWIAACLASAAIIGIDVVRHPQKMFVMNLVWPLTALYLGPVALWAYSIVGTSRHGGSTLIQSSVLGATHCGAGCALGDQGGHSIDRRVRGWHVRVDGVQPSGVVSTP